MGIENTDETGKYHTKKPSNISHAARKSKHKHIYSETCLITNRYKSFNNKNNLFIYIANYCSICGKIDDMKSASWYENTKRLTDEEILEKYSYLNNYYVEDIFNTKYIDETTPLFEDFEKMHQEEDL